MQLRGYSVNTHTHTRTHTEERDTYRLYTISSVSRANNFVTKTNFKTSCMTFSCADAAYCYQTDVCTVRSVLSCVTTL